MDTPAFYALADRNDRHHEEAVATYQGLLGKAELLAARKLRKHVIRG
ncbi:MAG: hypothetical protein QXQ66_08040 [Candidatus Hadarchaeum sp.]